jgi:hypothetical protein
VRVILVLPVWRVDVGQLCQGTGVVTFYIFLIRSSIWRNVPGVVIGKFSLYRRTLIISIYRSRFRYYGNQKKEIMKAVGVVVYWGECM